MVIFALFVFANLEGQGIKCRPDLLDCPEMLREIGAFIRIIRTVENRLRFFESDPAPRVLLQPPALARIEMESHKV